MKVLQKISSVLDSIFGFLVVIMIGAMVIITTAQIICRVWFTALSWSEEVTRFLLIWATFLGATCVYRRSGNIAITAVQTMFPESKREIKAIMKSRSLDSYRSAVGILLSSGAFQPDAVKDRLGSGS